jgi:hypothetical protein
VRFARGRAEHEVSSCFRLNAQALDQQSPAAAAAAAKRYKRMPNYNDLSKIEQSVWLKNKFSLKYNESVGESQERSTPHLLVASDRLYKFNTTENSKGHLTHMMLLHTVFGEGLLVTDSMLNFHKMRNIPFVTCEHGIK